MNASSISWLAVSMSYLSKLEKALRQELPTLEKGFGGKTLVIRHVNSAFLADRLLIEVKRNGFPFSLFNRALVTIGIEGSTITIYKCFFSVPEVFYRDLGVVVQGFAHANGYNVVLTPVA